MRDMQCCLYIKFIRWQSIRDVQCCLYVMFIVDTWYRQNIWIVVNTFVTSLYVTLKPEIHRSLYKVLLFDTWCWHNKCNVVLILCFQSIRDVDNRDTMLSLQRVVILYAIFAQDNALLYQYIVSVDIMLPVSIIPYAKLMQNMQCCLYIMFPVDTWCW